MPPTRADSAPRAELPHFGPSRTYILSGRGSYSVTNVSSKRDIALLAGLSSFSGDTLYNSAFFLASISDRGWIPRVCVVRKAGSIIGVVHAKEKKFGPFRTGLIYADATLDNLVVSDPLQREQVLEAALCGLLDVPGIRGIRLMIQPTGYEYAVLERVVSSNRLDACWIPAENHTVLPLAPTYEEFLGNLGRRTRRNFRHFRRHFEAAGHTWVNEVPLEEVRRISRRMLGKAVVGADKDGTERAMNMLSTVTRPLLTGLRARNGEWLAILGGWSEPSRVTVFLQMNDDQEYADYSLSVVLRGYLIEKLIDSGIREVVFWAGVGGPLARYTCPIPSIATYLDKPTVTWRGFRDLLRSAVPFLPAQTVPMAKWIIPSAPNKL